MKSGAPCYYAARHKVDRKDSDLDLWAAIMNKDSTMQDRTPWLYYYFLFILGLTIVFLVISLLNPSDSKRAIFLGYSMARIVVVSILAVFAAISIYLVFISRSGRRAEKIIAWIIKPIVYYHLLFLFLLVFSIGLVILASQFFGTGGVLTYYIQRLLPFAGWLVAISIASGVAFLHIQGGISRIELSTVCLILIVLVLGACVHVNMWRDSTLNSEDIYYTYLEGNRLLKGENPYERVLTSNMRENDKFATNFPGFYYLSAGTQALGLQDFPEWVSFWRIVFLVAALVIAGVIGYLPGISGYTSLAFFSPLFWLFNRWTLHVTSTADIEFLPLAILLLSLLLVPTNKKEGFLLFGLSLSIRQMGLILVPMVIVWAWWSRNKHRSMASILTDFLFIGIFPIVTILPFLLWNSEGFIKSILFSATRFPVASADVLSLDALLGWVGIGAKIPLVVALALVYWFSIRRNLSPLLTSFLVLLAFLSFNSVLFTSYLVWMLPFIPLVVFECLANNNEGAATVQS